MTWVDAEFGTGESSDTGLIADVAGPPLGLLIGAYAAVGLSVLAFMPDSRLFNIIGYLLGAVVTAMVIVLYRAIDRRRRLSSRYVIKPYGFLVPTGLVLGIAVAAGHAYFLAQNTSVA